MRRTKPPNDFLTPPMIAAAIGSRPETVVAWIRSGELVAVDLARRGSRRPRFRVRRADFEKFLERRTVTATPVQATRRRRRDEDLIEFV